MFLFSLEQKYNTPTKIGLIDYEFIHKYNNLQGCNINLNFIVDIKTLIII